jgi:hypothetical protein
VDLRRHLRPPGQHLVGQLPPDHQHPRNPAGAAWLNTTAQGEGQANPGPLRTSPADLAGWLSQSSDQDHAGNPYWSFNDPESQAFDVHANTAWNTNTITVGAASYTQTWGGPDTEHRSGSAVGGFQLLQLDPAGRPVINAWYTTRGADTPDGGDWTDPGGLYALARQLTAAQHRGDLIILTSVNYPFATTPGNLLYQVAAQANEGDGNLTWTFGAGLSAVENLGITGGWWGILLVFNGAPSVGTASVTVTVTDSLGLSSSAVLTIIVQPPLSFDGQTFSVDVGQQFSQQLQAKNDLPYTTFYQGGNPSPLGVYTTPGTMPPGIDFSNWVDGLLVGTPTKAGTYTFTVEAYSRTAAFVDAPFTIIVDPAPTVRSSRYTMNEGQPFSAQLTGTGTGTLSYATSSPLPPGLSVSSAGVLSGTPTAAGNWSVPVTVTDPQGGTASATLSLNVTS